MVRAYLFLSLFIPITFLFSISTLFGTLVDKSGRAFTLHTRIWARISLFLAGTRVTLYGAEHLPPGPVIFMSNHQSGFDIPTLLASLPRETCWIVKKELFDIPVFGNAMRRGGYIPLDRRAPHQALKSMEKAVGIIRSGTSVVIFPEGTRSTDFRLLPFKRGGFMLALRSGAPVVPVTINGTGRVNPAGSRRLYRGQISVTLHPPIMPEVSASRGEAEAVLMKKVHDAITSVLEI
ncbi:MAG: 1-acyl-sn-glycerol-3-phosphate acyltransferase [Desulfuromonadales bacterium]|nr:1-acyl-sn-glycerol-3-phosphate acyltransferase [Desulfuromonadales bacterium]